MGYSAEKYMRLDMPDLLRLDALFDLTRGSDLPLPSELSRLYGRLQFPTPTERAFVYGNFVSSVDGVVSLAKPGVSGGGDISGFNKQDAMVMGILRALADVVIVGAGTLRESLDHIWTAEFIFPSLANEYRELRTALGKSKTPLNVIVSSRGSVDLSLPVFQSGLVACLIVTTIEGEQRLRTQSLPASTRIAAVKHSGSIGAREILKAVGEVQPGKLILLEGGPILMGDFFAAQVLDELFLTFSPQIAGRDKSVERPGLVSGKLFAPENPLWGTLVSVKRGGSHLFLRYAFETKGEG